MKRLVTIFITVFTLFLLASCGKTKIYEVGFDENYGSNTVFKVEVEKGNQVGKPADPIRNDYTFLGWFLDDEEYDFTKEVESDFTLKAKWEALFVVQGTTKTVVGEYDILTVHLGGELVDNNDIVWTTSDRTIATVNEGIIRYLKEGEVLITAKKDDDNIKEIQLEIVNPNINDLMDYFKATAKAEIPRETINLVGSDDGKNDSRENFYPSVNNYLFNDPLDLDVRMLSKERPNHSNLKLFSLEWIVVHDTANINASALANVNFMLTNTLASVSWHYTVGTDGWFKSLDNDDVGFHAGDGSAAAGFRPTGIPATELRPKMTISDDGYYEILGIKTDVKAPLVNGAIPKTEAIADAGIWPVVMNGMYVIPATRASGSRIVLNGGNRNGIGIETSVQRGQDIWTTWHRTAKLVAHLLVENNLDFDRVVFHNHFSNKACPRTAMESDNWDNWLALMEFEYYVLKYFGDYTIEFESLTSSNLDNRGRITGAIKSNSIFEYKITITSPEGEVLEHTFSTLVNPK